MLSETSNTLNGGEANANAAADTHVNATTTDVAAPAAGAVLILYVIGFVPRE